MVVPFSFSLSDFNSGHYMSYWKSERLFTIDVPVIFYSEEST
jgi:hypothetical protein